MEERWAFNKIHKKLDVFWKKPVSDIQETKEEYRALMEEAGWTEAEYFEVYLGRLGGHVRFVGANRFWR